VLRHCEADNRDISRYMVNAVSRCAASIRNMRILITFIRITHAQNLGRKTGRVHHDTYQHNFVGAPAAAIYISP